MNRLQPKRVAQFLFGIAVSVVFLWLVARNVDGEQLIASLGQARPGWIALAIGIFLLGYACRIARWRSMLLSDNPGLSWNACVTPFMGSIAANNLLPFRAGDVLRVYGLSGHLGIPSSGLLASVLVERLLDILSLLVILGICLLAFDFSGLMGGAVFQSGRVAVLLAALTVLFLLLFPALVELPVRVLVRLVGKLWRGSSKKLEGFVDHLFTTLRHHAKGPKMAVLIGWSALAWGLEWAVFYASALAIPGLVEPVGGILAMPVATLATLLPSSPGYVGTFDFFAAQAAQSAGNPAAAATAFALLVHLIIWLPATLIGGYGIALWFLRGRPAITSERDRIG